MDQHNRPQGRDKQVTSGGSGVHRRGDGLGTGRVGNADYSGKSSGGSMGKRAAAGGGGILAIIIGIIIYVLGGSGGDSTDMLNTLMQSGDTGQAPAGFSLAGQESAYYEESAGGTVDTSVVSGARAKYTTPVGGGQDTVTLMVYMCGTDLESKYGMASSDMQEMASAKFGDDVNILVYTGGCTQWKTAGISNSVNQIYQVKSGGLVPLVSDDGSKAMTAPSTLSGFIQYCGKNYPASRYGLILWDHGGGSVSGYGYDEKNQSSGSMSLAGVDQALRDGGVTFDFVGFDACLMATAETALMLDRHADYLIASEETEPGIGWYYTNWLSKLGDNTSLSTLEIGQSIVDDFVTECARKCPGQKTTLSVIDLAEFSATVPSGLSGFSRSVSSLIENEQYKTVSDARYAAREFAQSSKIDQVDLTHLALNMGTAEGQKLADAVQGAVKYNRTSGNMTNAYGVSIYFPYKRTSYVDKACNTYSQIGMDDEYSKCIRQFASLETGGQIAAGGTGSPVSSLLGLAGSVSGGSSSDMIGQLLTGFLSSGRGIAGLDSSNTDFMSERALNDTEGFLAANYFDESNLVWTQDYTMTLPESQWELVQGLDLNMFYDDGEGWVDLGLDNLFTFDDDGNLVADTDRNWISIDGQPVAYYHTDTTKTAEGTAISGYVPAMLDGQRVNLILVFDTEHPGGYIAGADTDYHGGETDTVSKSLSALEPGSTLEFLCDFYSYDGEYRDSYYLGDPLTVTDHMTISNTDVGDGAVRLMYRFTDIYNQAHWSAPIEK